MLDTFIIGLREGLEAALIVSILIAYLVKTERKNAISKIWLGVSVAIAISISVALGLTAIEAEASDAVEATLSGVFSILAAVFVTWMIFWMAKQAKSMGQGLRDRLDSASGALSLAGVAMFA
ncbi:MAG: FTR1 family protein, partial [Micrococcales bacterium]